MVSGGAVFRLPVITLKNTVEENVEYSTIPVHRDRAKPPNIHHTSKQSLPIVAKTPSTPITDHLAYLLAQANREINRQLDARFKTEGVPVEQWRILKVLSDGKGHSMGDLAEAVLLNHPTLTKMVDRMVSDALVYRVQDPDDRRKVVMFMSDRGKTLTHRLNALALRQEAHIAENYGNKATADLKRLLESLIEKAN